MLMRKAALMAGFAALFLSACTSSRPVDALDSIAGNPQVSAASAVGQFVVNEVDPATAIARVRLSPVIGVPTDAAQALARGIQTQSTVRRIALLPLQATNPTHDLKGYFSAITESGMTTVIYVWDVFDPSGNRVHRIQGQQAAPGTSPDGWSSVSSSTMDAIGMRTVEEFAVWLSQRS